MEFTCTKYIADADEVLRLLSFRGARGFDKKISCTKLVKAFFSYYAPGIVKCYECKLMLQKLSPQDNFLAAHKYFSPNCKHFLNENGVQNY